MTPVFEPVGNDFGVLDVIGLWLNNARANELVFWYSKFFEHAPLMTVAWVGSFEEHSLRLCCPHNVDDVGN